MGAESEIMDIKILHGLCLNVEEKSPLKRGRSSSGATDMGTASPEKKVCTHKSSIRKALESYNANDTDDKQPKGLLRFFKKATKEEHDQYQQRMKEELKSRMEDIEHYKKKAQERMKRNTRISARERKRCQRERKKYLEIKEGIRSPGGKKIVVSIPSVSCHFRSMIL